MAKEKKVEKQKDIKPKKEAPTQEKKKENFLTKSYGKISEVDIVLTIRHLSLMLKAGISLTESIEALNRLTTDKKLKKVYAEIYTSIQSGNDLATSLNQHPKVFKKIIRTIVEVGEDTATLEHNLLYLADYLQQEYEMKRKVKGALMYPLIILVATIAEMLGVVLFVLPQLESFFEAFENKPRMTEIILAGSSWFRENILLLAGIGVVLWILVSLFFRTKIGEKVKDKILISFPIIKDLVRFNIYTGIARTLSLLIDAGIPLLRAIEITAGTMENSWYRDAFLEDIFPSFKGGTDLATSMEKHRDLFPESLLILVRSGEKSGTLAENLEFAYDFYKSESEDMVANMTSLLEPIMLIGIGLAIGGLALIIIVPMYQLLGSISV